MKNKIILAVAIAALMVSCEKTQDRVSVDNGLVCISFDPSMSESVSTKVEGIVTGVDFVTGEYDFGAFIGNIEDGSFKPQMKGYDDMRIHMSRGASGTGGYENHFKYYFDDSIIPDFPTENRHDSLSVRTGCAVDVFAYHPYHEGNSDLTKIRFISGEDDLMYAEPAHLTAEQTSVRFQPDHKWLKIPLVFHHVMTCIEVRIKNKYTGKVVINSLTLTDPQSRLVASGTMNVTDNGKLTFDGYTDKVVLTPEKELKQEYTSFFFLMPQTIFDNSYTGDFVLSFVFNGYDGESTFNIPVWADAGHTIPVTQFETEKRYIYELTLDNTMKFAPQGVSTMYRENVIDIEI